VSHESLRLLSFDLDNALYHNPPVIAAAEAASVAYLNQAFSSAGVDCDLQIYQQLRHQLVSSGLTQYENLTELRAEALRQFCRPLNDGGWVAARALAIFVAARSRITLVAEVDALLGQLAQHYILVSISNGNCNPRLTALSRHFRRHYSASQGFRAKPHPQMLQRAMADFSIQPTQMVHIGDSLSIDGAAADAAAVGFIHFAPFIDPGDVVATCQQLAQQLLP